MRIDRNYIESNAKNGKKSDRINQIWVNHHIGYWQLKRSFIQ